MLLALIIVTGLIFKMGLLQLTRQKKRNQLGVVGIGKIIFNITTLKHLVLLAKMMMILMKHLALKKMLMVENLYLKE